MTGTALTMSEIVALNVTRWRKAAGISQKTIGAALGWSESEVSARIVNARDRRFDAGTLVALAAAIGVPVPALLLPPEGAKLDTGHGEITADALLPLLLAFSRPEGRAAEAYQAELRAMLTEAGLPEPADPRQAVRLQRMRDALATLEEILPRRTPEDRP